MRASTVGSPPFNTATVSPEFRWLYDAIVDLQRASHEQNEVIGPDNATDGNLALFDGTTGKLIKDGGATSAFQPADATLTALAALSGSANKGIYFTGDDAFNLFDLSAFARTYLDDADAATFRATTGTDNAASLTQGTLPDARLSANVPLLGSANTFTTNQVIKRSGAFASLFVGSDQSSGSIGLIDFLGHNASGSQIGYARILGTANTATAGAEDGWMRFWTYRAGLITEEAGLAGGLRVGSPTGGFKGLGTINATAVYDDNSLLSCYVFDQVLDGTIDETKWDAKVPDRVDPETGEVIEIRQHNDMRRFKARIGTEYDPLDIDAYTKHWREKRHLTSLPNEEHFDPERGMPMGDWIQRLVETVEIQAVHIANLNERLKVLEANI